MGWIACLSLPEPTLNSPDAHERPVQLPVPSWVELGAGYDLVAPLAPVRPREPWVRIVAWGLGTAAIATLFYEARPFLEAWHLIAPRSNRAGFVLMGAIMVLLLGRQNNKSDQSSVLDVRGTNLWFAGMIAGQPHKAMPIPLAHIDTVDWRGVHVAGRAVLPLHSKRSRAETEALCALVNEAVQAHKTNRPTAHQATRVPWGHPPVFANRGAPHSEPPPKWATGSLHDTTLVLRRKPVNVATLQNGRAPMMLYAAALLYIAAMTMFGNVGLETLLVAWIPAGIIAIVAGLRAWSEQVVQVAPDGITFEQRIPPVTVRSRHVPMADLLGVSSAADELLFHLGDEVIHQPCNQPDHEVAALAAHLDRMVVRTPETEAPTPPDELKRMLGKRRSSESN